MSERLTKEICGFAHGLSGTTVEGALSATGKSWCRGQFEATACVERLFELETAFLDNSGENVIENDRLRELAAAEREGRVVVLPFPAGTKVFMVSERTKSAGDGHCGKGYDCEHCGKSYCKQWVETYVHSEYDVHPFTTMILGGSGIEMGKRLGDDVFLTTEEAVARKAELEAALAGKGD